MFTCSILVIPSYWPFGIAAHCAFFDGLSCVAYVCSTILSHCFAGSEGFEKMSASKIAESDSGAEDDVVPSYVYVKYISMLLILS